MAFAVLLFGVHFGFHSWALGRARLGKEGRRRVVANLAVHFYVLEGEDKGDVGISETYILGGE
jgi:hypothetical protein